VEFAVDLGIFFLGGGGSRPSLVCDSNPCIAVKNTLGWSAVVLCMCDNTFISVVSYVIRDVFRFDCRLVLHLTKSEQYLPCSDRNSCFWQDLHVFSPWPSSRILRESSHAVQVNCILSFSWVTYRTNAVLTVIDRVDMTTDRTHKASCEDPKLY